MTMCVIVVIVIRMHIPAQCMCPIDRMNAMMQITIATVIPRHMRVATKVKSTKRIQNNERCGRNMSASWSKIVIVVVAQVVHPHHHRRRTTSPNYILVGRASNRALATIKRPSRPTIVQSRAMDNVRASMNGRHRCWVNAPSSLQGVSRCVPTSMVTRNNVAQ